MLIVHLGRSTSLRVAHDSSRAVRTDRPPVNSAVAARQSLMGTLVGVLGSLNALMNCQMGDYRVDFVTEKSRCAPLTGCSVSPTTPQGDMHGTAAAASWSSGPMSFHCPA